MVITKIKAKNLIYSSNLRIGAIEGLDIKTLSGLGRALFALLEEHP